MSSGAPERPSGSNSRSDGAGARDQATELPSPGNSPPGSDSGPENSDRRRTLGAKGEELAARWYEDEGYEILDRNWRRREGEIDLIVRRGRTVAFCEVKTRSTDRFGAGIESVLPAKQRRIRRLAARWLSELTPAAGRTRVEIRFDVVGITGGKVEVIENAF